MHPKVIHNEWHLLTLSLYCDWNCHLPISNKIWQRWLVSFPRLPCMKTPFQQTSTRDPSCLSLRAKLLSETMSETQKKLSSFGFGPVPAVAGIWEVNQWMGNFSVSFPLSLFNTAFQIMDKNNFKNRIKLLCSKEACDRTGW